MERFEGVLQPPEVKTRRFDDDGSIPNNPDLPLLIYRGALNPSEKDLASTLERLYELNDWRGTWRNGVYPYHHYHSTAHEVLGFARGEARVQFGGENGQLFTVRCGDVAVLPAGVGHKNLGADPDFLVVGGYPPGQNYDMNYGKAGERPQVDENIARVPLPESDPIYGTDGPLVEQWSR